MTSITWKKILWFLSRQERHCFFTPSISKEANAQEKTHVQTTSYDLHHLENHALVPVKEGVPLLLPSSISYAAKAQEKNHVL